MESSKTRIYNTNYRKKLISKIERLNNKNDYINIYNLINEDINDISSNRNGFFININLLTDKCIENIEKYLNEKCSSTNSESEKINYKITKFENDNLEKDSHKLSNQDKNIIKRIRNSQ